MMYKLYDKPRQIYDLPMIELFYGDYLYRLQQIDSESVDVIITDPPYGINYQNNYTSQMYDVIEGDSLPFSYQFLGEESYRILKNDCPLFAFTGWSTYPDHYKQLEASGFSMKEPLICQKRASGTHNLYGSFQTNSDWILFGQKGKFKFKSTQLVKNKRAGTIPNIGRKPVGEYKTRFPSCWFGEEYPYSSENPSYQKANNIFHPTIKSLEFMQWLIQLTTNEGDLVVDPFMGSGTTAEACKILKRRFIGIEINQEYYNTSKRRVGQA